MLPIWFEGLNARGEDVRLLITEERVPIIKYARHLAPFPADVPVDYIRLTVHDRWSEAWSAIERYLEERAPSIFIPNVDFRSTCIVPRLSSRVTVVPTMMNDHPMEYEHIKRLAQRWDAVVAVNSIIHSRTALAIPKLAHPSRNHSHWCGDACRGSDSACSRDAPSGVSRPAV